MMSFFGGTKKAKQDEINENKKMLDDNIRKELYLVKDGKKLGNKNYMITGNGLSEEKDLIKIIIEYPSFNKFDETQECIFDACYKAFKKKAQYDEKTQMYGLTENLKKGFVDNLGFHKNKPLSVAYMDHSNYWFNSVCSLLEPTYSKDNEDRISILQSIGVDINEMINKLYPDVEDL